MRLASQKELTPVIYGELSVKHFRTKALPGELVFQLHWHDRLEIHRVIEGSLCVFSGDEQHTVNAGEVSVVSPQMLHHGVAGNEGVVYDVVMFDIPQPVGRTAASLLKSLSEGESAFAVKTAHPEVVSAVDRVVAAYGGGDTHPLETVGMVYELLGVLCRCVGVKEPMSTPPEERFGRVIAYINEQYRQDISTALLSRRFGYDESYFCRKFKRNTGVTVMRYIRTLRLEKAREMLIGTAEPVHRVAAACGFADAAYFANCFKRQYGVAPSVLRGE